MNPYRKDDEESPTSTETSTPASGIREEIQYTVGTFAALLACGLLLDLAGPDMPYTQTALGVIAAILLLQYSGHMILMASKALL